jgi:EAL domain-containing protein (putative c-di-GMP-specific phosphodiesterase class I)
VDILSKKLVPYFQPIIAIDTGEIYSYEVLGRYIDDDGSVKSLGPFFSDEKTSNADALKVDQIIRKLALEQYAKEKRNEFLFINLRLDWINNYADRLDELPTIIWAKEFGVDPGNLVIEITEEEFYGDIKVLSRVIGHYRRFGCRIAVDDYGKEASNVDRLALLSPDILKISMEYIQKSEESYHYREYLNSLTSFAKKIGVEVLYEGIETEKQLDICIDSSGRYYQGFLLAKPQPSMINAAVNHDVFLASAYRSIMALHNKADRFNAQRKHWDILVEKFFSKNKFSAFQDDLDEYFSQLFVEVAEWTKRIYVCDRQGEQLSYNIEMEKGKVVLNDYRHSNWAWRGFFQEAMIMLDAGMKSHLTAAYRDVITKEEIYTYTYAINSDLYLFIDIIQPKTTEF